MPTKVEDSKTYGQVITRVKCGNMILTLHIRVPYNASRLSKKAFGNIQESSSVEFLEYGILALAIGALNQTHSSVITGQTRFSFELGKDGLSIHQRPKIGTGSQKLNSSLIVLDPENFLISEKDISGEVSTKGRSRGSKIATTKGSSSKNKTTGPQESSS